MANYLVTGVAGFIAARVAEMLLDAGHTVVGIDNLNDAYDVRMKEYRLKQLQDRKGFSFHRLDISIWENIERLSISVERLDAVINLAARAGVRASVENPWVYVDTNVTGTLNLLELCQRQGISKFILASTSSIYGADAPLPTPESADSARPLQAYAASKKGAEAMAHAYHYLYDIDVSIVRFFTVYGPAGRPDMSVFRFIRWITEGETLQLNGDGTQSRGFTYIDDIARGVVQGVKPVGFEIFNLGGHEVIEMNGLINLIEKNVGREANIEYHPFPKADMKANQADVTKAGEQLGWEPVVGMEEGISRTIAWYNENRQWAKELEIV
ncbi:MAG: GDP-mannose 4,6-dehydratase [Anaerolineales bacterium]|nr:GDP-mannose 4,6-dehydratase [Chloroflexota bacterium]MBL6980233.1 GDP-mannose 4,6-dehydratase [Anaerolineales bacterium]